MELKEGTPIEVYEVTKHLDDDREDIRIQTKVITDGTVDKVSDFKNKEINECYIGNRKYHEAVDTLNSEKLYLKDYSYVVTCTLAKEFMAIGNVVGYFDVIKGADVYLKNTKDIAALKKARKVLKELKGDYGNFDFSGSFSRLSKKQKANNTQTKNKRI